MAAHIVVGGHGFSSYGLKDANPQSAVTGGDDESVVLVGAKYAARRRINFTGTVLSF